MDQREQAAMLFDKVADTYDAVGVELFRPVATTLVAELGPPKGARALDIGCGRGAALYPLAEAVGSRGHVTGIDASPRMVELTAADVAAAGLANVDVAVGDAQQPDLPEESYDVIASSLVLFFLADPAAALRAWHALLVPGGLLGVSTFGPYDDAWRAVDALLEPYLPARARDARTSGAQGPFGSDAGVAGLFSDVGFVGVRTATSIVEVRFADVDHWFRWSMSVGQRAVWESVPPESFDALRDAAYEQVERCRDAQGRIGFDQVARYTLGRRG